LALEKDMLSVRALADLYKALADETRLQMLVLLSEREELCVCDFVGALDITQSKASRHLRNLYHSGLLADRRDGIWIHYRISPELSPEARTILGAFQQTLGGPRRQELVNRLDQWFDQKVAGGFGTCLG
jgi:ArsR family transcriptional regulator